MHMENFTLHMQASHDNIRYLCDQCDFKATCKGNLGDSIHKGVQYLWAHCGYTSSTKNNFNRHMQSMHKEEYDKAKLEKDPQVYDAIHEKVYFTCKSCHYKTAYNGDLKKHMQSWRNYISL